MIGNMQCLRPPEHVLSAQCAPCRCCSVTVQAAAQQAQVQALHQQQKQHRRQHMQDIFSSCCCSITAVSSAVRSSTVGSAAASSRRSALLHGIAAAAVSMATQMAPPWPVLLQPAAASIVDEAEAQSVYALAARSVVSINDVRNSGGAELLEGVATGIVWDKYGHVVTNYHVVSKYVLDKSGQQGVSVVLDDGSGGETRCPARVLATDAAHDLAVLQINVPRDLLIPIRVGSSADLKVGQTLYAVGNPGGLSKSLTAGVVSGLNRTIPAPTGTRIYGVIQTDAVVNAGNSGGPVLDSYGRLVGVATASFTRASSGRGSGVNFALPVDLVRTVVPNLIVYGTASGRGVRSG